MRLPEFWRYRNFLRNLWTFRVALWRFVSFDFTGLLGLMEVAAQEMAYLHLEHGVTDDREEVGAQLMLLADICYRLREEPYDEMCGYRHDLPQEEMNAAFERWRAMQENDLTMLAELMCKVRWWWD